MKTAEMGFSKLSVSFGRCDGNSKMGWRRLTNVFLFCKLVHLNCQKVSSFKFVAKGVREEVTWGHNVPPPPPRPRPRSWARVKLTLPYKLETKHKKPGKRFAANWAK